MVRVVLVGLALVLSGVCLSACGESKGDGDAGESAEEDTGTTGGDESGTGTTGTTGTTDTATTTTTGPQNMCDLCEQDCPEGDKCIPVSIEQDLVPDYLVCEPELPNAVPIGQPCQIYDYYGSGKDNCEVGSFCVLDEVNGLTGYCAQTCCPNKIDDGCPIDEVCEAFFDGVEGVPPVPLCMPGCDPIEPTSCANVGRPGWNCIPNTLGSTCEFLCVPPTPVPNGGELGGQGTPCLFWSDCKPGLHCQPPEVVGCEAGDFGYCCTAYCDTTGPNTCPDGMKCAPFDCQDPNFEHVGACILDQ